MAYLKLNPGDQEAREVLQQMEADQGGPARKP